MKTILLTIVIFRLILAKSETTEAATSASIDNIGPPVLKDDAVVAGSQPGKPISSLILDMLNKEFDGKNPKTQKTTNGDRIAAYTAKRLLFAGLINTGAEVKLVKIGKQRKLPEITGTSANDDYLRTLRTIHGSKIGDSARSFSRYRRECTPPGTGGRQKACRDIERILKRCSERCPEVVKLEDLNQVLTELKSDAKVAYDWYTEYATNGYPVDAAGVRSVLLRIPRRWTTTC
eukprot:GHVU01041848.1.p1 GENE.GHVU01041848.1~~GHVU01041848.1.p1  ORF type:complete len:233 (+),score=18.93 GHVU01041848.1:120-818(+)